MQVYRRGDTGAVVAEIRAKLARLGALDSAAGDAFDDEVDRAIRGFQQARGLRVDGVVGPETYRALDEARWRLGDRLLSRVVSRPMAGDDVASLQERLLEMGFDPGRCDGVFGEQTERALREFQRNVGLLPDGTCGPATLKALDRLRRTVIAGSPSELREQERLMRGGPTLAGKVIVIDPGHGGDDLGCVGHGVEESTVVEDVANRIEGRLGALGAAAYLTRGPDSSPSDEERAAFANAAGADVLVSLHADAAMSELPHGVASFFYGASMPGRTVRSAAGERLASLLQREIVARTDLLDCRSHPKSWLLLRSTRMPAVRIDLGYVTNVGDATRLASPDFRDVVAEGIIAALQRLWLPPELDVPTGQFRIPVLA